MESKPTTPTSQVDQLHAALYEAALEYLDRGWSIIPLSIDSKLPLAPWREYQTRRPTVEEVTDWFENGAPTTSGARVRLFNLALVTGAVSGIVVVDADNQAAIDYCEAHGLATHISVRTTRGTHYYWKHPNDGTRYANKAGSNALSDPDWPDIPGLDFRGDGGYVVMPPSVKVDDSKTVTHQYEFVFKFTDDFDDLPVWTGTKPMIRLLPDNVTTENLFASLDLSNVRVPDPDQIGQWRAAEIQTAKTGKIPDGGGRGSMVTRYAGEMIANGVRDPELTERILAFMDTFFMNRLPNREWKATVRSLLAAEARNHPDREPRPGNSQTEEQQKSTAPCQNLSPFTDSDIESLLSQLGQEVYSIDPWLKAPSIVQIFGYSGHGKSWITTMALWHLAQGRDFGPFSINKPQTICYVDLENSIDTIVRRFERMKRSFGPTYGKLKVVSPAIQKEVSEINLNEKEGVSKLEAWIKVTEPDVVVIDTIRTAYIGLEEGKAEAWKPVMQLALALRNAGMSVVLLHHANKPQDSHTTSGGEAGSTNQLTVLEQQIKVTQLYETQEKANAKRGKFLEPVKANMDIYMKREAPTDRLLAAFEWTYGKVRNVTENHEDTMIAVMERDDGTLYIIAPPSPRQRAEHLYAQGKGPGIIARELELPKYVVEQWVR